MDFSKTFDTIIHASKTLVQVTVEAAASKGGSLLNWSDFLYACHGEALNVRGVIHGPLLPVSAT